MEATAVSPQPHRDARIYRLRMWFHVKNPDDAVNEKDIQSFLTEFAEVHFMSAAAAPSRAEALINNGFTSKHAIASLTAVQLEQFGFLIGHAQALASYMGAQQPRMDAMNSPPSTGVTATGRTSPPPNDSPQKTQIETEIETAATNKRSAAEAFPEGPSPEAPSPAPAEAPAQSAQAPAQSSSKPQSGQRQHARSQCSGVSEARGLVPKNARKVSMCQHIVCSPHNALDLELDKQAPNAARSHSKLNVSLAVHFSN